MKSSIFKEYYYEQVFYDNYLDNIYEAIDVIIPVYHTNELWKQNLLSIYREIPVKRLLISDGGVVDDSLTVLNDFPRVEIYNHRHLKTLGKCISELIKKVNTQHFVYLHSDVYLPNNWFKIMSKYKNDYDWFGCPMNITVLVNYRLHDEVRPYAGSQFGNKKAFENIDKIDDDFVYRQEDFVFDNLVKSNGFKTGKIEDTFHYHQLMYRDSKGYDLNITNVKITTNTTEEEILRRSDMQLRGIVKYLNDDSKWAIDEFESTAVFMLKNNLIEYKSFKNWIKLTNKIWLKHFGLRFIFRYYRFRIIGLLKNI